MPPQQPSARARLLVVFLGDDASAAALIDAAQRIPAELRAQLAELAFLLEGHDRAPAPAALEALAAREPNVRIRRDARGRGHGGRRKIAFEYALSHQFDAVAVLEPDARYGPEHLGALWSAFEAGADFVCAAAPGGAFERTLHNLVLELDVLDYATPFRLIAARVLRRIPFHLNEDGRGFDTQILMQCRALGVRTDAVALPIERDNAFPLLHSLALALGYRAHQLHLTRRGEYLVDHDVHYSLKHHPSSSHSQVLDAIRPGSLVLDLGCSQGLLAAPLREKGVRVVGVDVGPPERVSPSLERYWRRDLEQPLEIPEQRVFDYVVCSDVIEHVIRRPELLRSVRRYLKPDGRLLISTPNIAIWFYRLSLLVGRFEYGPRGVLDETHVHLFTRATFRREVESAAFRVVRERVTALPFEIVFESTGRSALVRVLASAYHALARLWPEMFAYQFLLEAEVGTLLEREARAGREVRDATH